MLGIDHLTADHELRTAVLAAMRRCRPPGHHRAAEDLHRHAQVRPDQPRVPAGQPGGGQWQGDGGDAADSEEADALLQLVRKPQSPPVRSRRSAAVAAVLAFFAWLSGQNNDESTTVLAFNAQEYQPSEDADKPPLYVGTLTRAETDLACPRHGEVQSRTNAIAHLVTQEGGYDSPQRYGTEVHKRLAYVINGPGGYDDPRDPDFRAEYSLRKSAEAPYGTKGSVRVDIFERVNQDTVCVYDIKTGDRGLGAARMDEIAFNVNRRYPGTRRVIVIETRPRQLN